MDADAEEALADLVNLDALRWIHLAVKDDAKHAVRFVVIRVKGSLPLLGNTQTAIHRQCQQEWILRS